jgi:hypothetical protein
MKILKNKNIETSVGKFVNKRRNTSIRSNSHVLLRQVLIAGSNKPNILQNG